MPRNDTKATILCRTLIACGETVVISISLPRENPEYIEFDLLPVVGRSGDAGNAIATVVAELKFPSFSALFKLPSSNEDSSV